MATVIVSFTTKVQVFPGIVEAGKFSVAIPGVGEQLVGAGPVTFEGVAPGDYTVEVVRFDTAGQPLGDKIVRAFTVEAPVQTSVDVPDVVEVQIS